MSSRLRISFLIALLATGCQRSTSTPVVNNASVATVTVKVTSPKIQPLHWSVEQPGTVHPFEITPVVAKLAGFVKEISPDPIARQKGRTDAVIDIGSPVKKGQLLAVLDIPELIEEAASKKAMVVQAASEIEQARKSYAVAESRVEGGEAKVREAEAGVPRAQADVARWKSEFTRIEDLVTRKVIDPQNRDETLRQLHSAEAALLEANAKLESTQASLKERRAEREHALADIATAEAKHKVSQSEARRLEALVGYTQITAPFDGIVTARNVHTRHFLQPGAGSKSEVLFTVARLDIVRVFFDVPESAAEKIGPNTKATVHVPALGNRVYGNDSAHPISITRHTGVLNADSRTLRAEIDIPNTDEVLRPGMYVTVQVASETPGAMVLPAAAILPADETSYCFLVQDGKAMKYRVRVGRTDGGNVQVLDRRKATAVAGKWEPFLHSDQVVVGNLGALADGVAVQVAKE